MTESGITFGVMCAADMMSSAGIQQFAKQAEAAGLDQIWIPELLGRDPFLTAALILRVTDQIRVGTAIANVYVRDARATKSAAYSLVDAFGDRFDLGLGVSNPVGNVPRGHAWLPPVTKLQDFVDRYDAAELYFHAPEVLVPRYLAAHGPKLMKLAGERFDGAFTYLQTLEYSQTAKALLGNGRLNLMQPTVFLEDPVSARALARKAIKIYLPLENYHRAWRERGFVDADFTHGGTDDFIDALIPWGDIADLTQAYQKQIDHGVGHIIMTPLGLELDQEAGWAPVSQLIDAVRLGAPSASV